METDEDLIVAYVSGDERAFTRLVERHLSAVYTYAVRFAGQSDAEDVTQETFLKAWKNIRSYSSTTARFKTWLMRVARNTAIDYLRKRKSIPLSSFENTDGNFLDIADEGALPEELVSVAYDTQEIERALKDLSPIYREIITLYYDKDLTLQETAHILEIPLNTAKSRFRRALASLRKALHPKLV